MTLTFSALKSDIKRHLSIIGKRMFAKSGENMFSNITVSTVEDPIFEQYIKSAAQNVEALLRQLVTAYSETTTTITLTLVNTRGSSDFDTRCAELVNTYVVLSSVGEYLAMTHPDLAEKYRADAANAIQSLIMYAFHKNAPQTPSYTYANVTGTIS